MSEGYHVSGSPFGKTGLCIVWKTVFAKIDTLVEREGVAAVSAWAAALI